MLSKLNGIIQIKPQPVESTTLFANALRDLLFGVGLHPDFGDPESHSALFQLCQGSAEQAVNRSESKSGVLLLPGRMNKLISLTHKIQKPAKSLQEILLSLAEDVPFVPLWQKKVICPKPVRTLPST